MNELEPFPFLKNHTCLVNTGSQIIKLKLIYPDTGSNHASSLSQNEAHDELEDVFRAFLYSIEREQSLTAVQTDHFVVRPSFVPWALSKKVAFKMDGKNVPCYKDILVLNVTVKGFHNTCQLKDSRTYEATNVEKNASRLPEKSEQLISLNEERNASRRDKRESERDSSLSPEFVGGKKNQAASLTSIPQKKLGVENRNTQHTVLATPRLSTANSIGSHSLRRASPLKKILKTGLSQARKRTMRHQESSQDTLSDSTEKESSGLTFSSQSSSSRNTKNSVTSGPKRSSGIMAKTSQNSPKKSREENDGNMIPSTHKRSRLSRSEKKDSVKVTVNKKGSLMSPKKTEKSKSLSPQKASERIRKMLLIRQKLQIGKNTSQKSNVNKPSPGNSVLSEPSDNAKYIKSLRKNHEPSQSSPEVSGRENSRTRQNIHGRSSRSDIVAKTRKFRNSQENSVSPRKGRIRKNENEHFNSLSVSPQSPLEKGKRLQARKGNHKNRKPFTTTNNRTQDVNNSNSKNLSDKNFESTQASPSEGKYVSDTDRRAKKTKVVESSEMRNTSSETSAGGNDILKHISEKDREDEGTVVSDSYSSDEYADSLNQHPSIASFKRSPSDQEKIFRKLIGGNGEYVSQEFSSQQNGRYLRSSKYSVTSSGKLHPSDSSHATKEEGRHSKQRKQTSQHSVSSEASNSNNVTSPGHDLRSRTTRNLPSSQESGTLPSSQEMSESSLATTEEVVEIRNRLLASKDGVWVFGN